MTDEPMRDESGAPEPDPARDPAAPDLAAEPAPPVQPPSPVPPEWNPMPAGYPGAADQPVGTDEVAPPPPPAWTPPSEAKPASRLRVLIPLIVIFGFLGVVLFLTRNSQSADDLAIGQCFDVPTETSISTVTKHECTEAHDAEVFLNVEFNEGNTNYPISLTFERFAADSCSPAFATYVGESFEDSQDLTYGYFYPTGDSWSAGDRTVTCYVSRIDEAKLTNSVKGSGGA
jgi:hypothetical protein